ncbi:Phosphoglucomutase-3, partial [Ascosphaera acerosa]
ITFGTAGLRGPVKAGAAFIDSLTVIQTSQGLAKYLRSAIGSPGRGVVGDGDGDGDGDGNAAATAAPPVVVVGHDSRRNSARYARLAANAFLAQGLAVSVLAEPVPTPFVPFQVLRQHALAGVMITASHNPGSDNGGRVILFVSEKLANRLLQATRRQQYLDNGAQISGPADEAIAREIAANLEPWADAWDESPDHPSLQSMSAHHALDDYATAVETYLESSLGVGLEQLNPTPFVYTPLHGVGGKPFLALCARLRLDEDVAAVVDAQFAPDPAFPTTPRPNPEEWDALELAMQRAEAAGRTLVYAHDPDADRLAVAEKVGRKWHRFSGDQLGILLASFVLQCAAARPERKRKGALLTTAVSSAMLQRMAAAHGYEFHETLTGFKWLANTARRLEREGGYHIPFAYEEAQGYMFPGVCYDKDGLAAAAVFLAAESRWRRGGGSSSGTTAGLSPYAQLGELYRRYGYHQTLNTYFVSPDTAATDRLFASIRAQASQRAISATCFPVRRFRDATTGVDSGTLDGETVLPAGGAAGQMITIWTLMGVRLTIRASGTEPKVKCEPTVRVSTSTSSSSSPADSTRLLPPAVYIESTGSSSAAASQLVSQTFVTIREQWIKRFAPELVCAMKQTTSSGHSFTVPE